MKTLSSIKYVRVPAMEYKYLQNLQKRCAGLFAYFDHITEIKESRHEVREGKTVSQEDLFHRLGI